MRAFAQGATRKRSKKSKREFYEWSYYWTLRRRIKKFDYMSPDLTFPMNIKLKDKFVYTGKQKLPYETQYKIDDKIRFESLTGNQI